jgi:hypothetical protein
MGSSGSISLAQGGVLQSATTISSSDSSVQLSFQANTTLTLQGQSLTATAIQSPPAVPTNTKLIAAYELGPSNSNFSPALSLTLKYNEASLPSGVPESNLYIGYWSNSQWVGLASTVDTNANTVTAQVSHFSTFAILGKVGQPSASPAPPNFAVTELAVTPSSVAPGEQVTITATITNSGGNKATYTATLKINGVKEASMEVAVEPKESRKVTFTTSKTAPGSHTVTVGEKTAGFTVTGKAAASPMGNLPIPIIAAGGAIVILLIIIIALVARRRSA